MKICYIVALHAEAEPLIEHYGMKEVKDFFSPLPCELYQSPDMPDLSVVLTTEARPRYQQWYMRRFEALWWRNGKGVYLKRCHLP